MRYMFLIYSGEGEKPSPEQDRELMTRHKELMQETAARGIFRAAEPLASVASATTVRRQADGSVMLSDGPFAETKEQLAGYYILECENLDEALNWAAKIPTGCFGTDGCVEVRPMRFQ